MKSPLRWLCALAACAVASASPFSIEPPRGPQRALHVERLPDPMPARSFTFETLSVDPVPGGARAVVRLRYPGTTPRGIELRVAISLAGGRDGWSVTGAMPEVEP